MTHYECPTPTLIAWSIFTLGVQQACREAEMLLSPATSTNSSGMMPRNYAKSLQVDNGQPVSAPYHSMKSKPSIRGVGFGDSGFSSSWFHRLSGKLSQRYSSGTLSSSPSRYFLCMTERFPQHAITTSKRFKLNGRLMTRQPLVWALGDLQAAHIQL